MTRNTVNFEDLVIGRQRFDAKGRMAAMLATEVRDVLARLSGRIFASMPRVAALAGCDERTVRRSIGAGEIPNTRVGGRRLVPVA